MEHLSGAFVLSDSKLASHQKDSHRIDLQKKVNSYSSLMMQLKTRGIGGLQGCLCTTQESLAATATYERLLKP